MTLRRIGSALAALLLASGASGSPGSDVELEASVDREEVPLDGTVTLRITASSTGTRQEAGDLELPIFRDFDVVSRAQSEQMSFDLSGGAGSARRAVVYTLVLTPRRIGEATIEPARFAMRGKTFQTRPLRVRVLAPGPSSSGAAARGGTPEESGDAFDPFADVHPGSRDLLLRAAVDNPRPFVGQQITYSLYLLARVNVSAIEKLQLPRLDGFWTEEIEAPQQLVGEPRIIDGVPYRSFLLRRRALFPLRSGKVQLDPADVEVLTGFGMLFSRGAARRQSQAVHLDVQPLPPGKPAGFDTGNVGQWTLTASAEPVDVSLGQPITFRLVAAGKGNVRDLRLPRLGPIPGVRAYDPTSSDAQQIERGRVAGTRTVEQILVPERTGPAELPALAMEIFDPVQKEYRTLRTEPIRLQVRPGASNAQAAVAMAAQNLLAAGGVRPIRLHLSTVSRAPPPWTQPWFFPLLAVPPFGLALLLATGRARRALASDPHRRRIKAARGTARKRLRGAEALLRQGDAAAFYAEIARAVTGYLADKQDVVVAGLTRVELAQALAARGHPDDAVRAVVRLLDDCDRARFAPASGEQPAREAMLGRADQAIAELDRRAA